LSCRLGSRANTELPKAGPEVRLHGARADPEQLPGVAVRAAERDAGEDFGLAIAEAGAAECVRQGGAWVLTRGKLFRERGVRSGVAVGLDEEGSSSLEEIALGEGEVPVSS
jgi:hypothetical protein